jgi:hypothetical protein
MAFAPKLKTEQRKKDHLKGVFTVLATMSKQSGSFFYNKTSEAGHA